MAVFGKVKKKLGSLLNEKPKIAFFIDGPNIIRKEFKIDLREIRRRVEKYGR